ncbi:MAG: NADH-quinone oxidoreductase subunit H [Lachnospiraceae bacterium]|nr:NADH-quinone oxidoreductase subunit H [Lachnospiraceae bacterium]
MLWNLFYILVFPGLLFCVIAGLLLAGIDRKVVARMQRRIGPPIAQPLYDFLKLLGKETIIPRTASRTMFLGAPLIGFVSLIVTALFIPIFGFTAFGGVADLVVIIYLLTIPAVSIIMGGAASGSPYAGVGLSREMVAIMSYELPLVLVILAISRKAGGVFGIGGLTFSMTQIAEYQAQFGPMITKWSMIPAAVAMLLVIPCEVGNHPFDIAEAETEICEGTLVEYSGPPLAVYKLSHAIKMFIMSALFSALFLGGAGTGMLAVDALIFLLECVAVTIISMSLPHAVTARLKVEQVFKFFWTFVAGLAALSVVLVWFGL